MKKIRVITETGLSFTLDNYKFYYTEDSPKWIQKDFLRLIKFLMKRNYEIALDTSDISASRVIAQKEGYEISLTLKSQEAEEKAVKWIKKEWKR